MFIKSQTSYIKELWLSWDEYLPHREAIAKGDSLHIKVNFFHYIVAATIMGRNLELPTDDPLGELIHRLETAIKKQNRSPIVDKDRRELLLYLTFGLEVLIHFDINPKTGLPQCDSGFYKEKPTKNGWKRSCRNRVFDFLLKNKPTLAT